MLSNAGKENVVYQMQLCSMQYIFIEKNKKETSIILTKLYYKRGQYMTCRKLQ